MNKQADRLTIVHVIASLEIGGAERMLQRLLRSFDSDERFQHQVIALRARGRIADELKEQGILVETLSLRGPAHLPGTMLRLVRKFRWERPDVVQCWMYHADLIAGVAARLAGVRAVLWGVRTTLLGRNLGVSPLTTWIRGLCARLSRLIPSRIVYVANSARRLHEELGYDPAKSVTIPNGFVMPQTAGAARVAVRTELGLSDTIKLVGSVGRFTGLKDHAGFVKACGLVAAACPEAHFLLVGPGLDRQNVQLMIWIEESGAKDRFHLMGEQMDIGRYYGALDLFCLHSVGEGFPNVVAEAMAEGVRCVVTNVGDAAELVADTGLVVPPSDPASLAEALLSALRQPSSERLADGRRARQRIADHFSIEAVSARYASLYLDLGRSPWGKKGLRTAFQSAPSHHVRVPADDVVT